jgi:hypothetical protein
LALKILLTAFTSTILKTCLFKIGNQGTKFSGHLITTPDGYQIAARGFCLNRYASSGNGDPHPRNAIIIRRLCRRFFFQSRPPDAPLDGRLYSDQWRETLPVPGAYHDFENLLFQDR